MGYARSVQVGIKYARDNNYDYVIQMDADGQHLASEAKKMFKEIKKNKSDIVIGSRYLVNNGYHCPYFRRVGTKLFSILIKLFTGKKITDPLSGFQCLNRNVINYYAMCGNYPEYPDANLIIEMLLNGYKISEVPVKMKNRENGVSMHSGILRPIKYMITQFYICVVLVIKYTSIRRTKK